MALPLPTDYVAHDSRSSITAFNNTNIELNALGTRVSTLEAAPGGGGGGGFSAPFVVIAASNSDPGIKSAAHYVGGAGNDNQVQFNAALTDAAALVSNKTDSPVGAQQMGMVYVAAGDYRCNSAITVPTGVTLRGSGPLSRIQSVGCNSAGLIMLRNVNDRLTRITSLFLDGTGGGSCDAINYNQAGSDTSTGGYLITANDSYHWIDHLWVRSFSGTRSGVVMTGGGDGRGTMISHLQMRDIGSVCINMDQHSDSQITHIHCANADIGIKVNTGNTTISHCKTFYNNQWGFRIESGRHTIGTIQSQDDVNGVYVGASDVQIAGVTVDTAQTVGMQIAVSGAQVGPFQIFNRGTAGGGRFPTTTTGLLIGAQTDLGLYGRINPTNITTKVSGTPGARSHYAYTDGTTLFQNA